MKNIAENLKALIRRTNETLIELMAGIVVIAVLLLAAGIFIPADTVQFELGVLLGIAYALILVIHMTVTIENSLDMPPEDGAKYAKRSYFVRLVLTIAVVIAGLKLPFVHFAGVFLGMMSVKVSVWIRPAVRKYLFKKSK